MTLERTFFPLASVADGAQMLSSKAFILGAQGQSVRGCPVASSRAQGREGWDVLKGQTYLNPRLRSQSPEESPGPAE